jgi:putative ABC transport system ATP-binding protein
MLATAVFIEVLLIVTMAIIEISNASRIFGFGDAATIALDDVAINIEKGEFLAIMGPSGSGKTTLMNTIGLLDRPTHGTYKLEGRDVAKMRVNRRAKMRRDNIGFVFQSFNLLPRVSIIENVSLPLLYKGMGQTKRLKRAAAVLEQVGLSEREYFYPHQLSGGELQRAAIARALVNNPSIIIADEPTGNLDSESTRVVMELLGEVHKMGNTILMVTHNPILTRYASRIIYMRDGSIVYDEASAVGELPGRVERALQAVRSSREEERLAGVSDYIRAIPQIKTPARKSQRTKKQTTRTRKKRS